MELAELNALIDRETADEIPPFGARSVAVARELGERATGLLLEKIRGGDDSAFLSLEGLRESDPGAFDRLPADCRAKVYARALGRNTFFNAWGMPSTGLTATSRALIALGEAAVSVLTPLLSNRSEAPLEGSREATASNIYHNRICDYAWALISEVRNLPYEYSQDPADRDRQMTSLEASLKRESGDRA
jgi:hypothetical protein